MSHDRGNPTSDQVPQTRERVEYPNTFRDPDCGVPWPVCVYCRGAGLSTSAGVSTCPRCAREWPADERNPCPDSATTVIGDAEGATAACVRQPPRAPFPPPQLTRVERSDG